jgi:hypothetical protein
MYKCETLAVTLRKHCILTTTEKRVLRITLGIMRKKGTGEWRKLLNEELQKTLLRWSDQG